MSNFSEAMASNPPRLVVLYRMGCDGEEQFQWGIAGKMPLLSLVGGIIGAQGELVGGEWMPECDNEQPAFVLVWDATERTMNCWMHPDIPRLSLVGMLEGIKAALVNGRMGQHSVAQRIEPPARPILGTDGLPMRG